MKYLLDSSLCARLLRRSSLGLSAKLSERRLLIVTSAVVMIELRFGAEQSARPEHNHGLIDQLAARLTVLDYDAPAASHTGEIRAALLRIGAVIGPYDPMIAGHARSRGLIVVTGNLGEFSRVDGLRSEDWTN